MKILHIAAISISKEGGMGRVAANWQQAFEARGHQFQHIGTAECPMNVHYTLWGKSAFNYMQEQQIKADLVLVHEPASGYFTDLNIPVFVVSHGVEERGWEVESAYNYQNRTLKSYLLPKFLRFKSNRKGFKKADKILVLNQEDKDYILQNFKRNSQDVVILKNGYYAESLTQRKKRRGEAAVTFLFNASWLERKGTKILIEAFDSIQKTHTDKWQLILAGVGKAENVLSEIPKALHHNIEIIPSFSQSAEAQLYEKSDVFILPSYFEGQSLALTQAMASGLCCICSDNCGQRDFISHKNNGLLFKTGNVADLTLQIKTVLDNKNTIALYGNKAKEQVQNYTWDKVSNTVVDMCEDYLINIFKS